MTFRNPYRAGLIALATVAALAATSAMAETKKQKKDAAPTPAATETTTPAPAPAAVTPAPAPTEHSHAATPAAVETPAPAPTPAVATAPEPKPAPAPAAAPEPKPAPAPVTAQAAPEPAPAPAAASTAAPAEPAATPPAAPAKPTVNKGDNAWMMSSSVFVLLMTIPGLALFYGGLVRTKNMLSVLTHVFYTTCIVMIIWALYGYSIAFTGGSPWYGGLSKAFMAGITPDSAAATFTAGANISELIYFCFQMTFAAITPGLIVGAFAERMKFSAVALFIPLWATLVYFPIAHMVWYWAGPDAIAEAVAALAAATDEAAKAAAQAKLDDVMNDAGKVFLWGAIDFAGGTVVHINAGIAGLVAALLVGKRIGYGKELMAPHSLTQTMIGATLLWVGWFGFNAGSALEASGSAGLAMTNTFLATAAAAMSWMFAEWMFKGKPSLLGALSGCIAGLVAVTPAAGYSGPMGAIVLGLAAGVLCLFFVAVVKNALGYDDALDVFGVHCIGGILGALATGILVNPALGGTGVFDYVAGKIADYDMATQMIAQGKAVLTTLAWSGIGTAVILKIVDVVVGLRPTADQEREGLDLADHGERAYNY